MQHLGEVRALVVQGTCSIPIPTLAAGWSGGGEFLGVETHILGQPSPCTCDAAVVARDHQYPNPSGAGAAPGTGFSSLPEQEEQFAACRGGNLAEAAPLCLLIQKLGLLSWNDFFSPQLMVPVNFPAALLALLSSLGSRIRSSCVLPYTKPSRCCQGQILTRRA